MLIFFQSNHFVEHDFEKTLVQLLNDNGLVANLITCNQGDYDIDIIATFN